MEVKEEINDQNVRLTISTDWEEVKETYENILHEYSSMPVTMIRRQVSKSLRFGTVW